MTQEEKARAYDEALERAMVLRQEAIDKGYALDYIKDYETIFPELAESDDERIRKQLIDAIKIGRSNSGISFTEEAASRYIAWLEKQKEQKLVEKQDYSGLNDLERAIHRGFLCAGVENVPVTIIKETAKECLAQMKSAEWSEKDEYRIRQIERIAQQAGCTQKLQEEIHDWLKSLRPSWRPSEQELGALKTAVSVLTEERTFPKAAEQIQKIIDVFDGKELRKDWKPSGEQMKALEDAFRKDGSDEYRKTINSLYQDLKKLM